MARVGLRYQLVIDKDVREQLSVRPGDLAFEYVRGDRLIVVFVPRRHTRSLKGCLAGAPHT